MHSFIHSSVVSVIVSLLLSQGHLALASASEPFDLELGKSRAVQAANATVCVNIAVVGHNVSAGRKTQAKAEVE